MALHDSYRHKGFRTLISETEGKEVADLLSRVLLSRTWLGQISRIELRSRGVILLLVERRHRSPDLPVLATLLHVLFLLSGFYDKSAQLLGQCQLDLRLLTQRGGEVDLQRVVSSYSAEGSACCLRRTQDRVTLCRATRCPDRSQPKGAARRGKAQLEQNDYVGLCIGVSGKILLIGSS